MTRSRREFLALSGLSLASTGCIQQLNQATQGFDKSDIPDGFLNIAHQGGAELRPSNTLPAFRNAVEIGADVPEMDIHSTKDNELVVIHDDTVDRTTDGSGEVSSFTLEEIKELDAGHYFTRDGETYPFRGEGLEIPLLEEVLTEFPNQYFLFEPKKETVSIDELIKVLRENDAIGNSIMAAFDTDIIREVRRKHPDIPTGMGVEEIMEFIFISRRDEISYDPPASLVFPPKEITTPGFIERADRHGVGVYPWTVNDRDEMQRLISIGVDGLITDDPETLEKIRPE